MDTSTPGARPGTIAIVEDDPSQCLLLQSWLEADGHEVLTFSDGESLVAELPSILPDAFVLDLHLPGMDGLEVLRRVKRRHPDASVVMLTSDENVETVVAAMREGALEYLVKPSTPTRVLTTVGNAVGRRAMQERVRELEREVEGWGFPGILGTSPVMEALYRGMHRVAPTDVTVLVQGESGTGKELVARAIHRASRRARAPFVALNCAAVPPSLQESEMFGHERGAFTGATARRIGRFEQADGGTLFLDEVAELGRELQAQLLRVLQERSFHRVGGTREVQSDFRLIAATHRDLRAEVAAGRFREDLYFRLAVFELTVPPLRERGADVILLAQAFARDFGLRHRGEPCALTVDAEDAIRRYAWPGNVRELQNAIQRAVLLAPDRDLPGWALPAYVREAPGSGMTPGDVCEPARSAPIESASGDASGARGALPTSAADTRAPARGALPDAPPRGLSLPAGMTLDEIERAAVRAAVRRHDGNRAAAARELGIARTTVYRKLGG